MLGNKVTDFDLSCVGEFGYILKLDITELNANRVYGIQAQTNGANTKAPSTASVPLETLQSMVSRENALTLAFTQNDNVCFVFFRGDVFPYQASTRFVINYLRGIKPALADNDCLDISDRFIQLVKYLALRDTYLLVKGSVPKNIEDAINRELFAGKDN